MELFKLLGTIAIDNEEANKEIDTTSSKAEGLGSKLAKGVGTAAKFGTAMVGGAAVAAGGMVKLASDSAAAADNVDKMSAKIGLSKQGFQEWSYILGQNGMDINSLQMGMKTLVSQMDAAASGTASSQEAFEKLGLSVTDSDGNLKSQEDMMNETLAALAEMEEGTEKARLANELFGRSGSELMPMLNQGAEGINELRDRSHELGLIMSDEAVNAGVVLGDTIDDVKQSFAMLGTNLGSSLMPIVQQFAEFLIANLPMVQDMFSQLAPILTTMMERLLPPLMQIVSEILPIIMDILTALMPTITQIVDLVLPILLDLLSTLLPPLLQIVQAILPVINTLLTALMPIIQLLLEILKPILDLLIAILVPIIDIISMAIQPLIDIVGVLLEKALKPLNAYIQVVAEVFRTYLSGMFETAQKIISKITGVFKGIATFLKGVFTGDFKKAFQGLADIVKNIFGAIVEIVKAPINAIISLINGFIGGLNKIKIPDWVPGVGGKGINIPKIPKLESGGVLEKGQTGLLEGNGAEAVVPLENNAKWIRSLSNDMESQGIGSAIDYEKLSDSIVDALRDVIPELNQTVRVVPDESGIFRVVRDKAREYTNKTGNSAFA